MECTSARTIIYPDVPDFQKFIFGGYVSFIIS